MTYCIIVRGSSYVPFIAVNKVTLAICHLPIILYIHIDQLGCEHLSHESWGQGVNDTVLVVNQKAGQCALAIAI